jgi:hypothetical protein
MESGLGAQPAPSTAASAKAPKGEAAPAVSETSDKVADDLVQSLTTFVQVKSRAPEKPEPSLRAKQILSLGLLVLTVSLGYILMNAWVPFLFDLPLWRLLGQFLPIAVGAGYIASGSKKLQKYLAHKAESTVFLILMAVAFALVSISAGFTQIPYFSIPVDRSSILKSFCVQPVDDLDAVRSAAASLSKADKNCAGGQLHFKNNSFMHSLKLLQSYMITLEVDNMGPQSFYLDWKAVWARFWGGKSANLSFQLGSLKALAVGQKRTISIIRKDPSELIIVPSDEVKNCFLDEDIQVTKCDLNKDTIVHLIPGNYEFKLDGCKVTPSSLLLTPTQDNTAQEIKIDCKQP